MNSLSSYVSGIKRGREVIEDNGTNIPLNEIKNHSIKYNDSSSSSSSSFGVDSRSSPYRKYADIEHLEEAQDSSELLLLKKRY